MTKRPEITHVTVYLAEDGNWYYAAWSHDEYDHGDDIPDAETEAEAISQMTAKWPAAKVYADDGTGRRYQRGSR